MFPSIGLLKVDDGAVGVVELGDVINAKWILGDQCAFLHIRDDIYEIVVMCERFYIGEQLFLGYAKKWVLNSTAGQSLGSRRWGIYTNSPVTFSDMATTLCFRRVGSMIVESFLCFSS